ncbi:CRISPR-associated protein Cas2 [Microbulbifer thermotolerans]|uniref:CRISPR-associated endoribonuclease Cas2 n=1 Tax=Microbulbifer thermotolerans TaxID=252514 RepID=A0AB35HYG3_MICTH|nr:CRISPR-associated endonuclease Cas2 [Microbulbifer thermotolerans]MCX2802572.1 CRISPR-associated endonuclease Cas2 [Microbulbifer thermotolerans]SFD09748.1 CRISPR-associated protein Cas2 [Microbulbifer thermotolerans]
MRRHHYLICYDIADRKRLARVFRACRAVGTAYQYSVFHLHLSEQDLNTLLSRLEEIIDQGADDIRVYRLQSPQQIETLGKGPLPEGIFGD